MECVGRQGLSLSIGRLDPFAADAGPVHPREVAIMRIEHVLPPDLLGRRPVRVLVVGAGGTGSAIAIGLPYLHQAMLAWGHAYGLEVTLMDADTVSDTNCVRQPFSWSDIGQNKATVPIARIN